jgi:electron transfer flavoprotein beta subunit
VEILVLVKPVPEAESRLRPSSDGTSLDPEGMKFVLAGYDESAVEQALLLKEAVPGSHVRIASLAPGNRAEEVLRAGLALGCDGALKLELAPGRTPDVAATARALALAAQKAPCDLVLLGKQSGDAEEGLLPLALAARLGRPGYSFVVDLKWDAGSGRFTFRRVTETGDESFAVPAPVVIGLQQAWNDPRTAKLQNILKSRRMPIEAIAAAEVASALGSGETLRPTRFLLPPPRAGAKMIEYSTPGEAAAKLVRALREEAKVI